MGLNQLLLLLPQNNQILRFVETQFVDSFQNCKLVGTIRAYAEEIAKHIIYKFNIIIIYIDIIYVQVTYSIRQLVHQIRVTHTLN